jgi:energy-coupling factor transporter ATP-binding protein EcfA2
LFHEFRDWSHFKIKELSTGNIRMIETFLILKSKTDFCILDEPFSHLSPKNANIFMEIMKQEKENKGIILTDHMYYYVTQVSDELYVIKDCVSYPIAHLGELEAFGYLKTI